MKNKIPNLEFEVLDSKKIRVSNQEVIEKISRSRVLLQTSDSEGTGLPILEALGLGVAPVTRDVGIAKEILLGELSKFIVNTDLDDIEKTIQIALKFKNRELLINTYDSFISRAKSENVVWQVTPILLPWERSAPIKIVKIKIVWLYRHFISKRTI
jgi:glycosyltransferase involved in cell wall biosynthesis